MRPYGKRVILKVDLVMVEQPDGTKREEPSSEAKVMMSNTKDIKKGDTVFFNYFGAISIESKKTKKSIVLVVDEEDIFAIL
jgi:co-chaperonin GroES (HSP10)